MLAEGPRLLVRQVPLSQVGSICLSGVTEIKQRSCFRLIKGLRLQLHGAIYRLHSFVLMLRYCANLKAIKYESTNLNRIVADKSHRVIVALDYFIRGIVLSEIHKR